MTLEALKVGSTAIVEYSDEDDSYSSSGKSYDNSSSFSGSGSYGYPSNPKDYSDYEDYYYDNE